MNDVYGQCSCGSVAYRFTADKLIAYQCHCSICRKVTGSAFSTTLMAPERSFSWLRGEDLVSSYAKENGYRNNFCSRCGSPVPNKFRDYPLFNVPVGSIESGPPVEIAAQIFMGSRAHWDSSALGGRQYDEMPSLDEMLELLGITASLND